MFKNIGTKPSDLRKNISEIYKANVKYLSQVTDATRESEIIECKREADIILRAYETLLAESTKTAIDNVYSEIEKAILKLVPNLKLDSVLMMTLVKNELESSEELELDFKDVKITTGSSEFFYAYQDCFTLYFDAGLGEDLIIFKYNDIIKTIDFSNMSVNVIREIKTCRKKHLSMIDAIKTKI